eukprot:PhM_4_TR10022/c1_g1_i1/m.94920/K06631/PLK1; polo-like kinase 1
MNAHRYRPSYGTTAAAAAPGPSTYRTSSTPRTSTASSSSSSFATRIEFKDNCGAIIEERNMSGRVVNRYRCGRILGRGGFAKCFEFTNVETREIVACKVIEKASLSKPKAWQKLQSEIAIHKKMKNVHIVNFLSTFQDAHYVYITLEICHDQTLMELTKARRRFTVPETQYFMLQILSGVQYMHDHNVIHRDLKLGNVMLHEMVAKIGDFGLAAEVAYDGERKRTICGTPNYIAPEILEGSHSFEVDIWSIGVILYTMMVGKPPFETSDVKTTYNRIKQCRYSFPPDVDIPESGKRLVHKILQAQPMRRPTLAEIRGDVFFSVPVPPMMTPASLLADSVVPRAKGIAMKERGIASPNHEDPMNVVRKSAGSGPMSERGREPLRGLVPNVMAAGPLSARAHCERDVSPPAAVPITTAMPTTNVMASMPRSGSMPAVMRSSVSPQAWAPTTSTSPNTDRVSVVPRSSVPEAPRPTATNNNKDEDDDQHHLTQLHDQLHKTLLGGAADNEPADTAAAAALVAGGPTVWVTDYADFSHKYGLAYRLSTGNTGVHYNDNTKMVWDHPTNGVEYVARQKEVVYGTVVAQDVRSTFNMDVPPSALSKKVTLIKYFRTYLARTTPPKEGGVEVVACTNAATTSTSPTSPTTSADSTTYVKRWMLTKDAIIFRLSNRTIQVCFLDKTEIMLSSESKVVTYTDKYGHRATFGLKDAGLREDVAPRLKYTKDVLFRLIERR